MPPSFRFLLSVCPVLVGSSLTAAVVLDDLVKSSPFLPGGQESAVVAPTENAAVEFRGMVTTKDGVFFGLYDRTKQTGAWVKKEDAGADFVVRSYDPSSDMVSVDYHGQKFNLALSSAKIGMAAASVPMPVASMPGVQPVHVTGGPTQAVARVDDQRRLETISAEVRRRRALRQGAASGTAPQPAPAPAPASGTQR
ncbi:MAG: hypothetical protein WC661_12375 [Opitutaceae bacterium]|jgi:hypothetical protein